MRRHSVPMVDLHAPIIQQCGAVPQKSCWNQTGCWSPHCPCQGVTDPLKQQSLSLAAHRTVNRHSQEVFFSHHSSYTQSIQRLIRRCAGIEQLLPLHATGQLSLWRHQRLPCRCVLRSVVLCILTTHLTFIRCKGFLYSAHSKRLFILPPLSLQSAIAVKKSLYRTTHLVSHSVKTLIPQYAASHDHCIVLCRKLPVRRCCVRKRRRVWVLPTTTASAWSLTTASMCA